MIYKSDLLNDFSTKQPLSIFQPSYTPANVTIRGNKNEWEKKDFIVNRYNFF